MCLTVVSARVVRILRVPMVIAIRTMSMSRMTGRRVQESSSVNSPSSIVITHSVLKHCNCVIFPAVVRECSDIIVLDMELNEKWNF